MTVSDITTKLQTAHRLHVEADQRLAELALLALARIAWETWPTAAYILLSETDQNDSGELWVQAIYDGDHDVIAEDMDGDPIAYYLHHGNESTWLPYTTTLTEPGKSHLGEYLLNIGKVMREVSAYPNPTIHRMLDLSTAHLPPEARAELNNYEGVTAREYEYGWLLYVPPRLGSGADYPDFINDIWRYATKHDCRYVLLDRDAEEITDLPTYED